VNTEHLLSQYSAHCVGVAASVWCNFDLL